MLVAWGGGEGMATGKISSRAGRPCYGALADLEGVGFEGDVEGGDLDGLAGALLVDGAGAPGGVAQGLREADDAVGVFGVDVDGEAGAHVEGGVGFAAVDGAVLHDEVEDGRDGADVVDLVDEGLVEAHELAPAVTGDARGIVERDVGVLAGGDEADVDGARVEESLAVGAAVADLRQVALREAVGEGAAEG